MEQKTEVQAAPTPEMIVAAARALASVCDGAQDRDGHGYNGVDSRIMKEIAAKPSHSPRQLRFMWHTLRKYRGQLERRGFQYDLMVPPPLPERGEGGRFVQGQPKAPTLKLEWIDTPYGKQVAVLFAYDPRLVAAVKSLPKRWFNPQTKAWSIPNTIDAMDDLLAAVEALEPPVQFDVDGQLKEAMEKLRAARRKAYEMSRAESADLEVPTKLPPYPFQRAGVAAAEHFGGRCIIGDEMGLGKTVQALGFLERDPSRYPALVVVPSNVRVNWVRAAAKFVGRKALILTAKSSLKSLEKIGVDCSTELKQGYDIVVVNYDLLEAETVKSWIKDVARGDEGGVATKNLLAAGQYAMKALTKAVAKAHPTIQPKLRNIMQRISQQGSASNRKRFVKCFVNGTPLEKFLEAGFQTLIVDESHYVKEGDAQRTIVIQEASKRMKNVILLTGTMVLNRPREIFTQVQIANPDVFPNFMDFAKRYCDAKEGRFGWDFSGASNLEELERVLRERVMIRRLKDQVMKELPAKTRVTIPLIINGHLKEYQKEVAPIADRLGKLKEKREAWKATVSKMGDEDRKTYLANHAEQAAEAAGLTGYVLAEIEKAKQAATAAKFDDSVEFILNAAEQQGKVLVFAVHQETVEKLAAAAQKAGRRAAYIHGGVVMGARQTAIDAFQDGDLEILVCGIRAVAEGITLTAASTAVFVEFDWNPGKHQQAEDRLHRIGQEKPVTIYYLVAMGTIDEDIAELIDAKREVVNASLGEGERTVQEDGILDAIMARMVKK